jgi:hypothetical protein
LYFQLISHTWMFDVSHKDEPNNWACIHFHAEFHLKKPAYFSEIPWKCIFYIVLKERTVGINSVDGRYIYASELIKKNVHGPEGPLLLL